MHSVRKAFRQAGLIGSAHLLRHTFCSIFDGSDLALKDILGHTSFTMVNNYRHTKDAKAVQEHHQHSPVVKIYGTSPQRCGEVDIPLLPVVIDLAKEVGELKAKVEQLESEYRLLQLKAGVSK